MKPAEESKVAEQPKPRVKHEVKLLGLKRPEVLKGGDSPVKPVIAPVRHEVKLWSLMGTKKLKQGEKI